MLVCNAPRGALCFSGIVKSLAVLPMLWTILISMYGSRSTKVLIATAKQLSWTTLLALHLLEAAAHPVDAAIQGAYVTLMPGAVHLELDLTLGTEVVDVVLRSLDANADQDISDTEARTYAQSVLQQSRLILDGVAATWRLERISVPSYQNLKLQSDTLRIYAVAPRTDSEGAHSLSYDNRYAPVKSQCIANVFLQPGTGWRYRIAHQQHSNDGRQLTVKYMGTRS